MWKISREGEEEIEGKYGRNQRKVWKKSRESIKEIEGKFGKK